MKHYIPSRFNDGDVAGHQITGGKSVTGLWQDIYEASAVQHFDIGTRLQLDERVFRYACASVAFTTAMKAVHNTHAEADYNTAAVAYPVGTTTLTILNTAGTVVADFFKGGYVWIMDLVTPLYHMYRIKSNTIFNSTTSIDVTLEQPLHHAVPASTFTCMWRSPWAQVSPANSEYQAMVGINLIPVPINNYFWAQTWGPCFGTASSTIPGAASADRGVYYSTDGALLCGHDAGNRQRGGFVLSNTSGGGDQFYMLTICP